MQELWYRPIVLLIVLAGAYFAVRTNRVFSQNLHNDTDVSFLFNRCGKPLRRAYAAGILMQAGESICFSMVRGVLAAAEMRAGGNGRARNLLWQGGQRGGACYMLRKAERHRHGQKRRRGNAVHTGVVCRAWVSGGRVCRPKRLRRRRAYICRYCRGDSGAACMRARQGGRSLRWGSVCPIMFTDAVQLGRIVFAHSGMGLGACMGAGACLSAGLFLLNAYSAGENADMFPHPIYAAVYYQLRWSAAVITAFVVGMLMLCFDLEADANETTKAIMAAFVCFFGTRQLICAIGRLWKDMRINRVVCIAAGVAALITVLNKSALSAALNVIACAGMAGHIIYALSDSGWYFALMEDYRDRYVWHSIPHPDLMAEKEQDMEEQDI